MKKRVQVHVLGTPGAPKDPWSPVLTLSASSYSPLPHTSNRSLEEVEGGRGRREKEVGGGGGEGGGEWEEEEEQKEC